MLNHAGTLIRVRLNLQKITLKVRFPCFVTCAIKIDGKQHELMGESQLKNGQALMNITHIQNVSIGSSKELLSASQKKCALLIYLKSTSGKIPAGTIALPINKAEGVTHRELSRIQKCPDKNAIIQYEFYIQRLDNKYQQEAESTIQKILYPFTSETKIRTTVFQREPSPARNLYQRNISASKKLTKTSQIDASLAGKDTLPFGRNASRKEAQNASSILEEYYMQKRNNGSQREKIFSLQRELESNKAKMNILESELNNKTNKVVELEKEVRQASKRIEQLELEIRSNSSKMEITEKTNRDLSNQLKSMKQKMQEEKLSYENNIKRIQIREISAKEQIKSLNQKMYANENQKQRFIYQKNQSANEFEGREKKLREAFKEKEKKMNEQRSTLLKKIDSLQRELQKLNQNINQYKSKNSQTLQNAHELRLFIQSLQTEKQRMRNQNNDLRFELTKSRNEKKLLQQSQQNNSRFNEQRRNYRKQVNQKEIQINNLRQKITNLQNALTRSKAGMDEMQKTLKQRNVQLKTLQRDYNILAKQQKLIFGDLSDKDTKLNSMIQQLHQESKKSKMLEKKCNELAEALQDHREENSHHNTEHKQRIHILQQEIQKLNQQLFGYNKKLTELEKQNDQLQQMLEEKVQAIQNLQSTLIQVNQANQQYQFQKLQITEEKRELEEILNKKLEETEEQVKFANNKLNELTQSYQNKLANNSKEVQKNKISLKEIQEMLQEKEQKLTKINAKYIKVERELQTALEKLSNSDDLISKIKKQNEILLQKQKDLKKQSQDKQSINNSLRMNNSQLQAQIGQLQTKLQQNISELKKEKTLKQIQLSSFNNYKMYSIQAIQFILRQLMNKECKIIIQHPDQQFCSKCNTLCQKITRMNNQKDNEIQNLKSRLESMQKQLSSLFEEKEYKELDLNRISKNISELKKSTIQYSQQINAKRSLVNTLQVQIYKKESDIQELTKDYNRKINSINAILNGKNKEILDIKSVAKEKEQKINQLQLEVSQLSEKLLRIEKERLVAEAEIKSKLNQKEAIIRVQLEKTTFLQKEKGDLQKELKLEKQNLRKALRELQAKCYELEESQRKLQDYEINSELFSTDVAKYKQGYQQLKLVLEQMILKVQYYQVDDRKQKKKLESIIASCQLKQNQFLLKKAKDFYTEYLTILQGYGQKEKLAQQMQEKIDDLTLQLQNIKKEKQRLKIQSTTKSTQLKIQRQEERASLSQENNRLVAHINDMELQLSKKEKERVSTKKELDQLRAELADFNKTAQVQKELKAQMIKFVQQQISGVQSIKKLNEEMLKVSVNLEKEKKVSMFAILPLKELMKRQEQTVNPLKKASQELIAKYKKSFQVVGRRGLKKKSSVLP